MFYPCNTSNILCIIARLPAINCLYEDSSIFIKLSNYRDLFCGVRRKDTNIDPFVVTN